MRSSYFLKPCFICSSAAADAAIAAASPDAVSSGVVPSRRINCCYQRARVYNVLLVALAAATAATTLADAWSAVLQALTSFKVDNVDENAPSGTKRRAGGSGGTAGKRPLSSSTLPRPPAAVGGTAPEAGAPSGEVGTGILPPTVPVASFYMYLPMPQGSALTPFSGLPAGVDSDPDMEWLAFLADSEEPTSQPPPPSAPPLTPTQPSHSPPEPQPFSTPMPQLLQLSLTSAPPTAAGGAPTVTGGGTYPVSPPQRSLAGCSLPPVPFRSSLLLLGEPSSAVPEGEINLVSPPRSTPSSPPAERDRRRWASLNSAGLLPHLLLVGTSAVSILMEPTVSLPAPLVQAVESVHQAASKDDRLVFVRARGLVDDGNHLQSWLLSGRADEPRESGANRDSDTTRLKISHFAQVDSGVIRHLLGRSWFGEHDIDRFRLVLQAFIDDRARSTVDDVRCHSVGPLTYYIFRRASLTACFLWGTYDFRKMRGLDRTCFDFCKDRIPDAAVFRTHNWGAVVNLEEPLNGIPGTHFIGLWFNIAKGTVECDDALTAAASTSKGGRPGPGVYIRTHVKPMVESVNKWLTDEPWRIAAFADLCRLLGRDFVPGQDVPFLPENITLTVLKDSQRQKDGYLCASIAFNALHIRAILVLLKRDFKPSDLPECSNPEVARLLRVRHAAMLLMGAIHDDQ